MTPALTFDHADVTYRVAGQDRRVLRDLNFSIAPGEVYGLVGESGSGKSTAAFAAVGYLPRNGAISAGRVLVDGADLRALSGWDLRVLRGRKLGMVYQDPARALNPSLTIGRQMAEAFPLRKSEALSRSAEMLNRVRIADPARVLSAYPHELSGGMQQRVVIAMALSNNPSLLILDEPTTALDARVEADILDLIADLRAEFSMAILFISHNLRVVARLCDRVGVLYAGELVEEGPAGALFENPRHPYTARLLRALPGPRLRKDRDRLVGIPGFPPTPGATGMGCIFADRCAIATERCRTDAPPLLNFGDRASRCFYPEQVADMPGTVASARSPSPAGFAVDLSHQGRGTSEMPSPSMGEGWVRVNASAQPILEAKNLSKTFTVAGKALRAVGDVSFDLRTGETLGVVGESGSGKSSLARLLLGLVPPDSGHVSMDGASMAARTGNRKPAQLKALQMIFQNPGSALNRSQTVRRVIDRSLRLTGLSGGARETRLHAWARDVRLLEGALNDRPGRLSGGMQQRVAIARAFAGEPRIVICDEPTSALDVSVQAAILNLLADLQAERRVAYVFISHDLNVVHYLADRIAVLYLGRLIEIGPTEDVFGGPHHPYTEALLHASDPDRTTINSEMPSAANVPSGCVFQTRCPRKIGRICEEHEPELIPAGDGHQIRCHIQAAELGGTERATPTLLGPETAAPRPSA